MDESGQMQPWMQMLAEMSVPPVGYGASSSIDPAMIQAYMQIAQLQGFFPSAPPMAFAGASPSVAHPIATISVFVDGMKVQYQLTEDDLRKVFGRFGNVSYISIDEFGTSAYITFATLQEAQVAINELNGKVLNGLEGTLRVAWVADLAPAPPPPFPGISDTNLGMPPGSASMPWAYSHDGFPLPSTLTGASAMGETVNKEGVRKYICKFNIQIENCPEFQVARKIIGPRGQNMQRIVKQTGVKIRLRGRGSGYLEPPDDQESPEPMNLSLSSTNLRVAGSPTNNRDGYLEAKAMVEQLLRGIYDEYTSHCEQTGRSVPHLQIQCIETALPGVPGMGLKGDASQGKQKRSKEKTSSSH